MERRLAAILAADVVGYSRLMEADEEATARTLRTYREIIEGLVASHHGRVFGSAGDSVLAEFTSPVEAVHCAVDIQRELDVHNVNLPEDRRMRLRIGVNLGDVMVEGDNLLGDGVNVAARLETLAEPGGISLSRSVFDQVKKQPDLGYEYLGEHEVKNIAEPVQVYRVLTGPEAAGKVIGETKRAAQSWRGMTLAAAVVMLIGVAGAVTWLRPWEPTIEPASVGNMAFPLPEKPSIAVLPFDNLSGDPDQDYVVDGITDSIITALSKFSELFVIARNSSFTYKGKAVKIQRVAEELGVRYVLEGSYRENTDELRVTAQLIDALNGNHVWAEEYDRDASETFSVQDEIVEAVVTALAIKVEEAERLRATRMPTASLKAYDFFLRARDLQLKKGFWNQEVNRQARQLQEQATTLDPQFSRAYVEQAWTHLYDFIFNWTDPPNPSLQRAFELARNALSLDPSSARAHYALGYVHLYMREHDLAAAEVERAISLNPNDVRLRAGSAGLYIYGGQPLEAIVKITEAMRLNPNHEDWYWHFLGWASFHAGKYEEGLDALKRIVNPGAGDHRVLAATYARLGRLEEAARHASEVLKIEPNFTVSHFRDNLPYKNKTDSEDYGDALRLAGLPEN